MINRQRIRRTIATLGAVSLGLGLAGQAAVGADAAKKAPLDKEAVERIVRDYLEQHPELVIQAIESWREKQRLAEEERAQQAIITERASLFSDPAAPVTGNISGDVTIVEFFDYQCGYCKRVVDGLLNTIETDGNVKVVFKEFPILGPQSRIAAQAALASKSQGKYLEFHRALMKVPTALNHRVIFAVATSVGLDVDRLKKDMESDAVKQQIEANLALAEKLGIRGTPAFVIGDKLVPGAISTESMKTMIAEVRGRS